MSEIHAMMFWLNLINLELFTTGVIKATNIIIKM